MGRHVVGTDVLLPALCSPHFRSLWAWIKAAYLPLGMSFSILAFFQYIIRKLDSYTNVDDVQDEAVPKVPAKID